MHAACLDKVKSKVMLPLFIFGRFLLCPFIEADAQAQEKEEELRQQPKSLIVVLSGGWGMGLSIDGPHVVSGVKGPDFKGRYPLFVGLRIGRLSSLREETQRPHTEEDWEVIDLSFYHSPMKLYDDGKEVATTQSEWIFLSPGWQFMEKERRTYTLYLAVLGLGVGIHQFKLSRISELVAISPAHIRLQPTFAASLFPIKFELFLRKSVALGVNFSGFVLSTLPRMRWDVQGIPVSGGRLRMNNMQILGSLSFYFRP